MRSPRGITRPCPIGQDFNKALAIVRLVERRVHAGEAEAKPLRRRSTFLVPTPEHQHAVRAPEGWDKGDELESVLKPVGSHDFYLKVVGGLQPCNRKSTERVHSLAYLTITLTGRGERMRASGPVQRGVRRFVQRDAAARFEAMNSRTASMNSGRRSAPRAPVCVAPSITISFTAGRSFFSS